MGVFRLTGVLKSARLPCEDILVDARDGSIAIFVDQFSFVFTMLEKFSGEFPLLTGKGREVEACDYAGIRAIVYAMLLVLRWYNVELEFFVDGAYALGTEEGNHSMAKWQERKKNRDEKCWEGQHAWESTVEFYEACSAFSNLSLPSQCNSQVRDLLLCLNVPYRTCSSGADVQICHMMRRRNEQFTTYGCGTRVHSILTNDSDFAISRGARMLVANGFDKQNDLKKAVTDVLRAFPRLRLDATFVLPYRQFAEWAEENLEMDHLWCEIWDSKTTASVLRIAEKELPSFAVLCGNDDTKGIFDKSVFPKLPRPFQPQGVANWITQNRNAHGHPFHCLTNPTCLANSRQNSALHRAMQRADALYCFNEEEWAMSGVEEYLAWRENAYSWYDNEDADETKLYGRDHTLLNPVRQTDSLKKLDDILELQCRNAIPKDCVQLAVRLQSYYSSCPVFDPREGSGGPFFLSVERFYQILQAVLGIEDTVTYYFVIGGKSFSTEVRATKQQLSRLSIVPEISLIMQSKTTSITWLRELFKEQSGMDQKGSECSFIVTFLRVLWNLPHHKSRSYDCSYKRFNDDGWSDDDQDENMEYAFTLDELKSFVAALAVNRLIMPETRITVPTPGYDLEGDYRRTINVARYEEALRFLVRARCDQYCAGWRTILVGGWMEDVFHDLWKPLSLAKGLCGAFTTTNPALLFSPAFRYFHSALIYCKHGSTRPSIRQHPELCCIPRIKGDPELCNFEGANMLRTKILSDTNLEKLLEMMPSRVILS